MSFKPLVAVPVYNEQDAVLDVLCTVQRHVSDIVVVDDGSTDGTPGVLRKLSGVHVITHPENRGYGATLLTTFNYASRSGYDWLITLDADGQHEVDLIPGFFEAIHHEDADILSGTRYPGGHNTPEARLSAPAERRRINRCITALLNRDLGLGLTDAFCGFKAYRVSILPLFRITVPGYAMPIQLWVQAARLGLRIREIPVPLRYLDPNRHFGGVLDNPAARLEHYLAVYRAEVRRDAPTAGGSQGESESCACACGRIAEE
jgi:glycosyltransferase involved in cell wall biosynthesis